MATSYISLPAIVDAATAGIGTEYIVGRAFVGSNINLVTFRVGTAPGSGEVIRVRVGTNLDGVENTDYLQVNISNLDQEVEVSGTIPVISNQRILFRVDSESGGNAATDLSGSCRIEAAAAVSPAAGMYTTLARVSLQLGSPVLEAGAGDELVNIILGVSAAFDRATRSTFQQRELTEFHDGASFEPGIPLHHTPSELQADRDLATVTEDGTLLALGTEWFMDPSDPELHGGGRMIYRLDGTANGFGPTFARGFRNIEVTYKTAPATVPTDIALAATQESVRFWKNTAVDGVSDGNRIGLASKTPTEATSVSFTEDDFLPSTQRILNHYLRNPLQ